MVYFLRQYGYALIFLAVFAENLGLPLPSYLLILVGAALAAELQFRISGLVIVSVLAALLGDGICYVLGRLGGRRILRTLC
jgi:membrane protein DedA with SNARE-associated domain